MAADHCYSIDGDATSAADALNTAANEIGRIMVDVDVATWGEQPEVSDG